MKKIIVGSEGQGYYTKRLINYILRLKYPDIEIVWKNCGKCDIIVRSLFLQVEPAWNRRRIPYIYWSGERRKPIVNIFHKDCVSLLTTLKPMPNLYYSPFIAQSPYLAEEGKIRLYTNNERPFKVAYCFSNKVAYREHVFNRFAKKCVECHALGRCCGKFKKRKRKIPGMWHNEDLIKAYSQYDFVFAMENALEDGYITEKIYNAYAAGAIPIYYGSAIVNKFFNSKSFINLATFKNVDKCAEYVLGMSEEDIQKMRNEPIYNTETSQDDLDIIQAFSKNNKYYGGIADRIYAMCSAV